METSHPEVVEGPDSPHRPWLLVRCDERCAHDQPSLRRRHRLRQRLGQADADGAERQRHRDDPDQLPVGGFPEHLRSAQLEDADGELQFPEFIDYFNRLNTAILSLARPADLSLTAQMMEEQREELRKAKEVLVAQQAELEEKLKNATITNCDNLADEKRKKDEQVTRIEAELKLREKHLETAIKEQHKRRHDALHAKLAARKAAKD